jgi:hypothetical protein
LTATCQQCQDAVNTLTALFNPTPDPFSSSTPYNPEGLESSQSTSFPPHHFQWDLRPPRVEVNKFDGSDPTGWVTQMEHYFSLYDITDELAKLRYGVLHLDPECWQWWQWRKNAAKGMWLGHNLLQNFMNALTLTPTI